MQGWELLLTIVALWVSCYKHASQFEIKFYSTSRGRIRQSKWDLSWEFRALFRLKRQDYGYWRRNSLIANRSFHHVPSGRFSLPQYLECAIPILHENPAPKILITNTSNYYLQDAAGRRTVPHDHHAARACIHTKIIVHVQLVASHLVRPNLRSVTQLEAFRWRLWHDKSYLGVNSANAKRQLDFSEVI